MKLIITLFSVKLRILKVLMEHQFDCADFKIVTETLPVESLRHPPEGRDVTGLQYWTQVDHMADIRCGLGEGLKKRREVWNIPQWQGGFKTCNSLTNFFSKLYGGELTQLPTVENVTYFFKPSLP